MSVAHTFARAAALTGTSLAVVEDFARAHPMAIVRAQGQRVITENGLTLLQAYTKGIREARAATGSAPVGSRSAGVEREDDPSTWSEETIAKKGHAVAAAIKGGGTAPDTGLEIQESIRIRG